MLDIEHIEDWRGQDVVGQDGDRIGELDDVFYDIASGTALFVSVKTGLLRRHLKLIPLVGASVGQSYVRVGFGQEQISQAPESQVQGTVDRSATDALAKAYGLDLDAGVRLESATVIAERKAREEQARERAEELEEVARRRRDEAEGTRDHAQELAQEAGRAEREAQDAREVTEEAGRRTVRSEPPGPDAA